MKTLLPSKIETTEQVKAFVDSLIENDELFHFDDDATDIPVVNGKEVWTMEEALQLNKLVEQCNAICDIWDFLPVLED